MRVRIVLGMLLGTLLATPAFAVRTILYYENECCRDITEGEFAILYCQGLKLQEPAQGWTIQTAAAALSSLGHQPPHGWVLSRFLSEAVLAKLLENSPFYRRPYTEPEIQKSDRLVTIARARSAVPADDGLTQGEFAILLATALRLPIPADSSPETAIKALSSLSVPARPIRGWNSAARLVESDMTQILLPTPFRSTNIDPAMEISAAQAYSLLFGKYEIATQGHFGLFIVQALGTPPPPGGWTAPKALDYIQKEFGVGDELGWNPGAPLCTQTFESALRQILTKVRLSAPPQPKTGLRLLGDERLAAVPVSYDRTRSQEENDSGAGIPDPSMQNQPAPSSGREVDAIINEARRNGQIPQDGCATVPAQGLSRQSFNPPPPPPPPPPVSPTAPARPPGADLF